MTTDFAILIAACILIIVLAACAADYNPRGTIWQMQRDFVHEHCADFEHRSGAFGNCE